MNELRNFPAAPLATPVMQSRQITRLAIGFLWILAPFAIIALLCYLRWPAVKQLVEKFYQ